MLPVQLRPWGSENMKKIQKRFIRPLGADNTAKPSWHCGQLPEWKSPYLENYGLASFKELTDRVLGKCPHMRQNSHQFWMLSLKSFGPINAQGHFSRALPTSFTLPPPGISANHSGESQLHKLTP